MILFNKEEINQIETLIGEKRIIDSITIISKLPFLHFVEVNLMDNPRFNDIVITLDNNNASYYNKQFQIDQKEFIRKLNKIINEIKLFDDIFEDDFFQDLERNIYKLKVIANRINLTLTLAKLVAEKKQSKLETNSLEELLYFITTYLIDFEFELIDPFETQSHIDKRISPKTTTANERLKALKEFCPELITKLTKLSRKEQEQIIHLITGVNKTDAYKKVMTADSRELDNTTIKNVDIDFEELKNKLKNT